MLKKYEAIQSDWFALGALERRYNYGRTDRPTALDIDRAKQRLRQLVREFHSTPLDARAALADAEATIRTNPPTDPANGLYAVVLEVAVPKWLADAENPFGAAPVVTPAYTAGDEAPTTSNVAIDHDVPMYLEAFQASHRELARMYDEARLPPSSRPIASSTKRTGSGHVLPDRSCSFQPTRQRRL